MWAPKHIPGVSTFVAVVVVRFEEGGRGLCWRKKKGLVGIPEILPKGELKCAKECTWRHRKAQTARTKLHKLKSSVAITRPALPAEGEKADDFKDGKEKT